MRYYKMCMLFVFLVQSISISAQSVLSGRITDKDSVPMAGATVLLLNVVDSVYVTGTASGPDGRFEILNLKPDNYILSFSMMGFEKVNMLREVKGNTINEVGDILLEEDSYMLSDVTIMGRRPPVKIEPGKMIFNLSSALLNTDENVLDILRKLPGVIVQNDGSIILNGKSGANVLVDDKVTYLSGENLINYLRSIPTNSVENIELISQPSSRYDASGSSGIINIQKKRMTEQGIHIALSSALERGKRTRVSDNLSFNFRHNKLNISADYSTNWGQNYIEMLVSGHYLDPVTSQPLELRKDFVNNVDRQSLGHNVKTRVDYDLSDKIVMGMYFSSNWYNRDKNEVTVSDFFNNNKTQSDSTLTAISVVDHTYTNITGGANIVYKFADTGKWDAAFDYQLFNQKDDQLLNSLFDTGSNSLKEDTLAGLSKSDIRIYSGQTNLNYTLSEMFGVEAGLKTVFVNIGTHGLYNNRIGGNWQADVDLSSSFDYKENINAGYFQLNTKWSSRFSTAVGFRLENTYTKSNYRSVGQDTVFSKSYIHLFPTLMTQYKLSDKYDFTMAYGRRIIRPNYRNMNPFVEVRDQFLYEQGNTGLKPELIDNIEVSLVYRKFCSFNIFYSHTKDPISTSFVVEDNRVLVMPLNLSGNNSFGLRIGLNMQLLKWWAAHVNGSLTYKQYEWMRSGDTFKNKVITPMIHINNNFKLPYGWTGEAFGYFSGKMIEGQTTIKPLWTMSVGISRKLFNDKFNLYIYARDIFHSNRPRVIVDSNYLYYTSKEKSDTRMVGISLGYRFNRGREIKKSHHHNRIEESKRIGL